MFVISLAIEASCAGLLPFGQPCSKKNRVRLFFAEDTSALSLLEEASFNLLTMTPAARAQASELLSFAFVIALTLQIWASVEISNARAQIFVPPVQRAWQWQGPQVHT